ncbi:MAG: bifunctional adenosylcobinamide kinase/adenosylcobinamide-phosphate guanylyltransferase, partial [Parvibaculaceae bacterium]
ISNLMLGARDHERAAEELCRTLPALSGRIVIVSNEVGLGIVPDNALARAFRDAAGIANQRIAAAVEEVVFMAAGLPMRLKG